MKVLHLPHNIGSKITLTVSALRKIGLDAKGIAINNHLDEAGENVHVFNPRNYSYLNPKKYVEYIKANRCLKESIVWADVIHWYYDYRILKSDRFVEMIKHFNKPAVVEWLGSDIRISEFLSKHNPYYKRSFAGDYPYRFETLEHSRAMQKKFIDSGFKALVRPELEEFIQKDIVPGYHKINNRVDVASYRCVYPSKENKNPLLVHPVTSREAKGSSYILAAIEKLRSKYKFDFLLLENIPHEEMIKKLAEADVVIDQLILGAFGTISLEGMALGKPVVCYLEDSLRSRLPLTCPIVNANPDTIYTALESLINDPVLRNNVGEQSRKYIEEYHNADKIAHQLKNIYLEVISNKS